MALKDLFKKQTPATKILANIVKSPAIKTTAKVLTAPARDIGEIGKTAANQLFSRVSPKAFEETQNTLEARGGNPKNAGALMGARTAADVTAIRPAARLGTGALLNITKRGGAPTANVGKNVLSDIYLNSRSGQFENPWDRLAQSQQKNIGKVFTGERDPLSGALGLGGASALLASEVIPGVGSTSKKTAAFVAKDLTKRYGDDALKFTRAVLDGDDEVRALIPNAIKLDIEDAFKGLDGKEFDRAKSMIEASISGTTERGKAILKDRKLVESIKESPVFEQEFTKKLVSKYQQISNPETLQRAEAYLNDTFKSVDDAAAGLIAASKAGLLTSEQVAAAKLVAERLQEAGSWNQLSDFMLNIAENATEGGRAIQAYSLWGRFTPVGALRFTQGLIEQAKKGAGVKSKFKDLQLTPEATKAITEQAQEVQRLVGEGLEGSEEHILATSRLMKLMKIQVPPSLLSKVAGFQTLSMLLNANTFLRNVVGNVGFGAQEFIADYIGAAIDIPVSKITGVRSKAFPSITEAGKGIVSGIKKGYRDVKEGIDTTPGGANKFGTQKEVFQYFDKKTGKIKPLPGIGHAEKLLGYSLRVPDRAAFEMAYKTTLDSLMKATGRSIDDEGLIQAAIAEARRRTFQDRNLVSSTLQGLKEGLNRRLDFGLGDTLIKFTQVPGALLLRGLEWSPAGVAMTLFDMAKPRIGAGLLKKTGASIPAFMQTEGDEALTKVLKQRHLVEGLTRAGAGSGVMATGMVLYNAGIIQPGDGKDYDKSKFAKAAGTGGYTINLDALSRFVLSGFNQEAAQKRDGDSVVQYDWLQPVALPLTIGVEIAEAKGDLNASFFGQLALATMQASQSIAEQPVFAGAEQFAKDLTYNDSNFAVAIIKSLARIPATFVPQLVNQLRYLVDPVKRDAFDDNIGRQVVLSVLNRIPGVSKKLEPTYTQYGEEARVREPGTGWLASAQKAFINPALGAKVDMSPEMQGILSLSERTGNAAIIPRDTGDSFTIPGVDGNVKLNSKQEAELQRISGTLTKQVYTKLMNNPDFLALTDEEQAAQLATNLTEIASIAKHKVYLESLGIKFPEKTFKPQTAKEFYDFVRSNIPDQPDLTQAEARRVWASYSEEKQKALLEQAYEKLKQETGIPTE